MSSLRNEDEVCRLAIIGGGQIGSRHLQALARLGTPAIVYVVDPSPTSLEVAAQRFRQEVTADTRVDLILLQDPGGLAENLDVAIIATSADVRLAVLRDLLNHCSVRFLLLEKVLFQSVAELAEATRLLAQPAAPRAWVNCPRRLASIYADMRSALAGVRPLGVRVAASAWGLGCNGIHFLDLIQFLAGEGSFEFDTSGLSGPLPSKRAGFVELTGTIEGRLGPDVRFALTSYPGSDAPMVIEIESPSVRCIVSEEGSRLSGWHARSSGDWVWSPFSESVPYQSGLTHRLVRSLLEKGSCDLATFGESAAIHTPFLSAINRHLFGDSADHETKCPIT